MRRDFTPITELPGRKFGRERIEIIVRRYLFAAGLATGKRVLEVGCGPGLGLGVISGTAAFVVAGDVTSPSLAQAKATYRGRPRVRLVQFDGERLPFRNASFDVVIGMAMINYLDAAVFLDECRRVLVPGGAAVFCMPNRDCPGFRPSRFSTRYYSVPDICMLARQHGFAPDVFGVFPAPRGKGRLAQRAIAFGGTVLAALPVDPATRERLRDATRRLIRYDAVYLDGELTPAHMEMARKIPLVTLPPDRADFDHRIVYTVARAGAGEA